MFKNQASLLAIVAALAVASPAIAQDTTTDPATTVDPATTMDPAAMPEAAPAEPAGSDITVIEDAAGTEEPAGTLADLGLGRISAADMIGRSVVNAAGETIGDIEDVIIDDDLNAAFVVVGVGGFLGMGETTVALPLDRLQISAGEDATFSSDMTEEELIAMVEGTEPPAEDLAETAPDEVAPLEDPADTAALDTAPAEEAIDAQEPAAGEDLAAEQPVAEQPATDDMVVAEDTTATEEPVTDDTSTVARDTPFADMSAEDLIGKTVLSTDGDTIGEIGDIVVSEDKAPLAVIDVGGFLGIGEKPVAVPLSDLQVGEDEAVLMSGLTKESLEGMTAYEKDSWPSVKGPLYQ